MQQQQLLEIYRYALSAVDGRQCTADWLTAHPLAGPVAVIAIGKAAPAMLQGALDVAAAQITSALLITKHGHLEPQQTVNSTIHCLEAAHPLPDESSLAAGQALLAFIEMLPPGQPVLALISGGTSALVEVPADGVTLQDWQRVNQWLLGTGLDIHLVNSVRKSLSTIKGGRLMQYLQGRRVINLLISDVPGDSLSSIGSGLLVAHNTAMLFTENLPDWLHHMLRYTPPLSPTNCFAQVSHHLIATAADARQAAAVRAKALGYDVFCHDTLITGDALLAGTRVACDLKNAHPGVHIWSSETTVHLPENPGIGGRCQSLALAAACELSDCHDVQLLAAGTDGSDGPTHAAGALVDGLTVQRGQQAGLDAAEHLSLADAGTFLIASGDLVDTGPTGTNVMDLIIGVKDRSDSTVSCHI